MSQSCETTDHSSETSTLERRSVKRKLAETLPEPSSPEVTEAILAAELETESTAAQVRPFPLSVPCFARFTS